MAKKRHISPLSYFFREIAAILIIIATFFVLQGLLHMPFYGTAGFAIACVLIVLVIRAIDQGRK
jgi:hypothetical protein